MSRLLALVLVGLAIGGCADPIAYHLASDAERAEIGAAVQDYYAAKARLSGDLSIDEFWRLYPDLERKHDVERGINLEAFWAKVWKDGHETNYRVELEGREPLHAWVRTDAAIVRVHGLERLDLRGGETAGEIHTVITLRRRDGRWQIVETDEQMMGERPPTDPPTR